MKHDNNYSLPKVETWFSDNQSGESIILSVEPYRGKYKQFFTKVLRVSAPRTKRGWMEICC